MNSKTRRKKASRSRETQDIPSCGKKWSWSELVENCPFHVEQDDFPKTNSGHILKGPTPCTDGGTLWVPKSTFDSQVSFLFHEWAHALMHYPNGVDPDLIDPLPRSESVWEFEACLAATQILRRLGLTDTYNKWYLRNWHGEYGDARLGMVTEVVDAVVSRCREAGSEDRVNAATDSMNVVPRAGRDHGGA